MKTTNKVAILAATIITIGSLSGVANAATFVLDNTIGVFSDGLNNGDAITQDGVTLTFSNLVIGGGASSGDVENTGIIISSLTGTANDVISFDISFSHNVQILTYDIGGREEIPPGSFFTITGSNGNSGNNTIPQIVGSTTTEVQLSFDAGTIPFLEANQAYSFTHNLTSDQDRFFYLEELDVQIVPEPSSTILLGFSALVFTTRRRRVIKMDNKSQ